MSIAVSNASPLIAYSAIQRLDLMHNVFGRLLIPEGVRAELFPTGTVWTEAEAAQRAITQGTWIQVMNESQLGAPIVLPRRLGVGEREAIAVALARGLPLIIDDLEAREAARGLGIQVVGTLGIVARNKRVGTIPLGKPIIDAMQEAGIYYSKPLIEQFLRDLGEMN